MNAKSAIVVVRWLFLLQLAWNIVVGLVFYRQIGKPFLLWWLRIFDRLFEFQARLAARKGVQTLQILRNDRFRSFMRNEKVHLVGAAIGALISLAAWWYLGTAEGSQRAVELLRQIWGFGTTLR